MSAFNLTGSFLSSQGVSTQVLSTFKCLTTVFGMGTGGSTWLSQPDILFLDFATLSFRLRLLHLKSLFSHKQRTKIFVLCKSLSSLIATNFLGFLKDIFFQNYTEVRNVRILGFVLALSQALDLLVSVRYTHYCASTPDLSTLSSSRGLTRLLCEKPHLKAGFTLRCFQRLSFPNVATQLYCWRNNWYTIGSSTPVLSY